LKIEVPHRVLGRAEVHALLKMAAKLVLESLSASTKKKDDELYRTAYRKGLASAGIVCNSPSCSLVDNNTVESFPGVPEIVTEVLKSSERSGQLEGDPPLDLPCFADTRKYIRSLGGTSRRRVLGNIDGVKEFVSVIGRVETQEDDEEDEFFGKCIVRVGDHTINGYCLGSIGVSGTGIIICEDEQLIAYTPPNAADYEWPPMKGVIGAILTIDHNGSISLEHMGDVVVQSLAVW
jgi:hypothetical protein